MQNKVYRAKGLDMEYFPLECMPEDLPQLMPGIRKMNFGGLGVTKPNKLAVMPYLDEISPLAKQIGAVNTVVFENGKLIGHNTDGLGGVRSLRENMDTPIEDSAFFSFGAGGAGRALTITLAFEHAKKIYITDYYPHIAQGLVDDINAVAPGTAEWVDAADIPAVHAAIAKCQVVMNNSGLGMKPHLEETPVDKAVFRPDLLAFDATYNPARTTFLRQAEQAGCKVLNGLGMLVYQGAYQIELWTGHQDCAQMMFDAVREIISRDAE
jgi:shikimate dehydrogenase